MRPFLQGERDDLTMGVGMTKERAETKNGVAESLDSLGRQFLSALRGSSLVVGGMGGLVLVGLLLLLLLFPIFVFVSVLLKMVGL